MHRNCVFPSFLDAEANDVDDDEEARGKNVCPNRNRSYVPAKIECAFAANPPLGELIFFVVVEFPPSRVHSSKSHSLRKYSPFSFPFFSIGFS